MADWQSQWWAGLAYFLIGGATVVESPMAGGLGLALFVGVVACDLLRREGWASASFEHARKRLRGALRVCARAWRDVLARRGGMCTRHTGDVSGRAGDMLSLAEVCVCQLSLGKVGLPSSHDSPCCGWRVKTAGSLLAKVGTSRLVVRGGWLG
ncbi:hypothetical protein CRG98_022952 [Punica granatum]|uniref:Uncharacterized protein n=1 Tax=Punica granatum TaxID=22663 RepID=A0A2I0JK71_PUNGR|nr:hypothetical protein CRG98_022952 [Punica granatum]